MAVQEDKVKTLHLLDEGFQFPEVEREEYTKEKTNFTDAYAQEKAEKLGCDLLLSTPDTLQLDIDNDVALAKFQDQIKLLGELKLLEINGYTELKSKSGNTHIIVSLQKKLTIKERIMYQALLGSDVKREMLALAGYMAGQENPILLFRPKDTNGSES